MKVAVIGDVHANLPALEAVLAHARERRVEAIWNVGDWVGEGAFPDKVVRRLRAAGAVSIAGNHDLKILEFPQRRKLWRRTKSRERFIALKWAHRKLSRKSLRYLESLPHERRLEAAGRSVLLVHGSPAAIDEPLYEDTDKKRLRKLARLAKTEIVACGHTHRPFTRKVAGCLFVNPGSVGRPVDGDPRASYALLRLSRKRVVVRHYRVEYDVKRAVVALRKHDLPEVFAEMLRRGRKLAWVLRHRSE